MISKNIHRADRALRIALGLALDMWFFSGTLEGTFQWVVGFVCIYLLTSGAMTYCPLIAAIGALSRGRQDKSQTSRASLS